MLEPFSLCFVSTPSHPQLLNEREHQLLLMLSQRNSTHFWKYQISCNLSVKVMSEGFIHHILGIYL